VKRYGFANTDLGWNCLCGCFDTRGMSQAKKARQSAKQEIADGLEDYLLFRWVDVDPATEYEHCVMTASGEIVVDPDLVRGYTNRERFGLIMKYLEAILTNRWATVEWLEAQLDGWRTTSTTGR
jgi:hypothetical protein